MNNWDNYVYTYVPKNALKAIFEEGLYGGQALLKRPDLLELAAKGRGLSAKEMQKDIEKNLKDWGKESSWGPNVVFHLIPNEIKLSNKHPTKKNKLVPIKINLSQILNDYPETEIFGMELQPYSDQAKIKDRHHFIDKDELNKFLAMDPEEMWSRYNDIDDKGLYAPDVPHASIHVNNGVIPSKYLSEIDASIKRKAFIAMYAKKFLIDF